MDKITQKKTQKAQKVYTDYSIFQGKIRLITDDGPKILERDEAIEMAKEKGLTLVQIAYNKGEYPRSVCKIIDYGKYQYEMQKREKEARRRSRLANTEAKEVQFSVRIDQGDLNTKINHIRDFLTEDNERVKIIVKLSKRESSLGWMAKKLMDDIVNKISDISEIETKISTTDNITSCTVKPIK